MNRKGFTLMELLVTVLILGVLLAIAVPRYTRSLERARATEAMVVVKALNDAVYAYAAGRSGGAAACPASFSKLAVAVENASGTVPTATTFMTRNFLFTLNSATNAPIPGTNCPGVTATRRGTSYQYVIWNPYTIGTSGQARSLACTGNTDEERAVCESLDLYTPGITPY